MSKGVSQLDINLNANGILTGFDRNGKSVEVALDPTTETNFRVIGSFSKAARPGQVMPDGTIYAGVSPINLVPAFFAAKDATELMDRDEAEAFADNCKDHGYSDWGLPRAKDLSHAITSNRDTARLFERSPYWTWDTRSLGGAKIVWGETGADRTIGRINKHKVRLIRYLRGMN
ncbi:MAG: hypothetical protein AAGG56_12945 [Pseudomonadota bacterium]